MNRGHFFWQAASHRDGLPFWSMSNRYTVRPRPSVRTRPMEVSSVCSHLLAVEAMPGTHLTAFLPFAATTCQTPPTPSPFVWFGPASAANRYMGHLLTVSPTSPFLRT